MAENQVLIRYFAAAADIIGRDEETITFTVSPSLGDLQEQLLLQYGRGIAQLLAVSAFLVGGELTRDPAHPISAKVDVLPPFSGG
ncbi:MoaD/ThiS family protein [Rhodococcus opacus]|nr:MoaD/ThiS family protein [Rhodococcus opacus]RZL78582.1 MAG: MoaD/ThiS family protein [Rhodococcus sp. (in: high G+C Gram-positive bacteria)]